MHKIGLRAIFIFSLLSALIFFLSIGTVWLFFGRLPLGDFRGIALVVATFIMIYVYAIVAYRLFLILMPLAEGDESSEVTASELSTQVYLMFYVIFFNLLTKTHILPIPLMRYIYVALGAHMEANSYSSGVIIDPPLTSIGSNSILGHDTTLFCHVIEEDKILFMRIKIGNRVTIGVGAIIMPGVTIGNNALVAAGSVVTKGTHIGAGEIWGGIPAKFIKQRATKHLSP